MNAAVSAFDKALIDRAKALGCVEPAFTRYDKPGAWKLWELAVSKLSARHREHESSAEKVRQARLDADALAGHPFEGPSMFKRFPAPADPYAGLAASLAERL